MTVEARHAAEGRSRRPGPWPVVSLLCGLGFFCPLAPIFAVLAGIRGLIELRAHPRRMGRWLAATGIALGLAAGTGWGAASFWWDVHARRPMINGPAKELTGGYGGDLAAFTRGFVAPDAAAEEESARFISKLRQRYGRFISARQNPGDPVADVSPGDRWRPRIRYLLRFEAGEVEAEALFIIREPAARRAADQQRQGGRHFYGLVLKFGWLAVHDEELGDLVYPASAMTAPGAVEGAQEPSDAE